MSIDPKFVELTADVFEFFFIKHIPCLHTVFTPRYARYARKNSLLLHRAAHWEPQAEDAIPTESVISVLDCISNSSEANSPLSSGKSFVWVSVNDIWRVS